MIAEERAALRREVTELDRPPKDLEQRTGPHLDVNGARKWLTGGTASG